MVERAAPGQSLRMPGETRTKEEGVGTPCRRLAAFPLFSYLAASSLSYRFPSAAASRSASALSLVKGSTPLDTDQSW